MSTWYAVADDDVELSEDGKTIYVDFYTDYSGNIYVEIPVSSVCELLKNANARFHIAYEGTYNEQIYDSKLKKIYWTATDRRIEDAVVELDDEIWRPIVETS
jgi:hypothetical protein